MSTLVDFAALFTRIPPAAWDAIAPDTAPLPWNTPWP